MNKKAALSLSVNAIIVFVLAFAMLGVGLTVTQLFSGKIQESIETLDVSQLTIEQPSSSKPITLPNNVMLTRKGEEKIQFGFYNTNPTTAYAATVGVANCKYIDETTGTQIDVSDTEIPVVLSTSEDVPASEASGYLVVIKDHAGLNAGTYVCTLIIYKGTGVPTGVAAGYGTPQDAYDMRATDTEAVYGSKQFWLDITT